MPTYAPIQHAVRLSWGYLEEATVAELRRPTLHTFELHHPMIGYRRFVQDQQDLVARLEADAPDSGGLEVTFMAAPLNDERPAQSATAGTPELSLTLGEVAGLMADALDITRGSTIPWTITERIYAVDDVTQPCVLPPVVFELTNTAIEGSALGMRAGYGDPVNVAIPATTFKRQEYPGLQR